MMLNALTREELFLLVWERPSQEIARELGISDVALGKRCKKLQIPKLSTFEHALIAQYQYDRYIEVHSKLCVSRDFLWVVCTVTHPWYDGSEETLETSAIPLGDIAPIELVPNADVVLPALLELPKLAISRKRIEAFININNVHDILSDAVYRHDYPAPDDHLVLLEKLYLGIEADGPLTAARETCKKLEDLMERWELVLDTEREAICSEALGVTVGDTIVTESRGKTVRFKIEQMSAYVYEGRLNFHLGGKRYRKDGLLGKRDDSVYLRAEMDFSQRALPI